MNKVLVFFAAVLIAGSSATHAITLVGYDLPSSSTNRTVSPMSSGIGVTASSIDAGSGLSFSTNNTSSTRWQATSFNQTGTDDTALAAANTGGDYWGFSITANTGYNLNINGIGSFGWGCSSSGAKNFALIYSSNSAFSTYMIVARGSVAAGGTTNLTTAWNSALAAAPIAVTEGQTAYFRVVGYGATGTGGTGGFLSTLTAPDFSILGDSSSTTVPFSWTGGDGTWAVGTTGNWQSGGAAAAWINGRDANFANGGSLSVDSGGVNAGTLSISGATALSFSGGTVSASVVSLASGSSLSLGALGLSTATLDLVDAAISGGSCTVTTAATVSVSSGSKTFSTVLNGNAIFTKSGAGELVLASSNQATGQVGVAAGTLTTTAAELLPDGAVLKVDPLATFKLGGNETVGNLLAQTNASGVPYIDLQNYTLTYGGNNGSITNSAQIIGTGGFVKTGTGIAYLNNSSTYSGGFVINQGTVRFTTSGTTTNGVVSNSVFGTGPLTLNGGATITSSSASSGRTVNNAINLNGSVQFGDSAWGTTNVQMNATVTTSTNTNTGVVTTNTTYNALFTAHTNASGTTTLLGDTTINTINWVDWYQPINGNFRITKSGTGAFSLLNNYLLLRASNNIAGVTVSSGILSYKNRNALGSGTVILSNGVALAQDGAINNLPLTGNDQTDRSIRNNIRLDGDVTFGSLGQANHLGGDIDLNGGISRVIALGNSTYLYGGVTNGGQLVIDNGTGTGSRTFSMFGVGNYTRGTVVRTNAALAVGNDQALGSGDLIFTNTSGSGTAILRASTLSTNSTQVRTISNNIQLAAGSVVMLDAVTAAQDSIGTNIPVALNMVLAGNISGDGGLTKSNNNTVTLAGNNSYTGSTTIVNGTLEVITTNLSASITSNTVAITFSNTPANGTYGVLPGGLTGTYAASFNNLAPTQKATFSGASPASVTITNKASQSITGLASTDTKTTADAAYTLSVTPGASTNSLTFSSDNMAVATVSTAGLVTIVGAGTTTLRVNQAGDANYLAAPEVTQVLTVTSAGPTFESAYPGVNLADVAPNGLTYLANYAFGGSSNNAAGLPVQDTTDPTKLKLIAYVRTNNTSGTITVKGQTGSSLSAWDATLIDGVPAGDNIGAPEGTQKQIFSVDAAGDRQFLRLKVTK